MRGDQKGMVETDSVEEIIRMMNLSVPALEIQRIQTEHRLKLIRFWGIEKGSRILEIGCGQGDTLAALAYAVGKGGFVYGIDCADESYGTPETLGQARTRLQKGGLGRNLRMDFQVDVMSGTVGFKEDEFDAVVLSHCLWYLSGYRELADVLKRARLWGRKLHIAEWNPCIEHSGQLAHWQAASIQAVCESFEEKSRSNIRSMFYPSEIERAVLEGGWQLEESADVFSEGMQDGIWEASAAVHFYPDKIMNHPVMPDKLKRLLLAQIEALKKQTRITPMSVYCVNAARE